MLESAAVRALLLSLAAGLSTLLGALVVFAARRRSEKLLAVSLGFAGGVMLAVSFTDLFPTAREHLTASLGGRPGALAAVLSLAAGIGCAAALDHLVPHDAFDADTGEAPHKNLFRVGFVSALAMALHNFPEGVATFLAGYEDLTLGVSITLAIALHNIPEGISVAMPVWYATGSRRRAFRCTLLSGLTEPGGVTGRITSAPAKHLSVRCCVPFSTGCCWGCCSARWPGSWSISRWKSSSPPPGSTATTGRPCGPRCAASA